MKYFRDEERQPTGIALFNWSAVCSLNDALQFNCMWLPQNLAYEQYLFSKSHGKEFRLTYTRESLFGKAGSRSFSTKEDSTKKELALLNRVCSQMSRMSKNLLAWKYR